MLCMLMHLLLVLLSTSALAFTESCRLGPACLDPERTSSPMTCFTTHAVVSPWFRERLYVLDFQTFGAVGLKTIQAFCNAEFEPEVALTAHHIVFKMPSVKRTRLEDVHEDRDANTIGGHPSARSRLLEPLLYSGSLDSFRHQDLTPVIGREFEGLQVTDLLRWGDAMIKDLAITGTTLCLQLDVAHD